jgi:hypothetical protein
MDQPASDVSNYPRMTFFSQKEIHFRYFLTSAKTGDGIDEAFYELAGQIVKNCE